MKTRLVRALGLFLYLTILCLLFQLDWGLFLKPKPFVSVLAGTLILTACQYKRRFTRDDVIAALRWNAILSGFLTTLISVFSSADIRLGELGSLSVTAHLLPLLYASILYLLLGILLGDKPPSSPEGHTPDLTATETAEKVFRSFGLTKREYHVAHKLLSDMSNKEIAADLYISEATVKKHIQNIYQKSGASDRTSFRDIYFDLAKKAG
jgi:DNA-binding CsgD family transcriptional regulator